MPVVNRSQTSATGILSITSEVPFELYNEKIKWAPFEIEGNRYDFVCGSQGLFEIKIGGITIFSWTNEYEADFDLTQVNVVLTNPTTSVSTAKTSYGTYVQWKWLYDDISDSDLSILVWPDASSLGLEIRSNNENVVLGPSTTERCRIYGSDWDTTKPLYVFIGNVLVAYLEKF